MADGTEIPQRIARLTPLADVLARVDALVKSVAPREIATEVQPIFMRLPLTETHRHQHAFAFGRVPQATSTPSFWQLGRVGK